MQPLPLLNQTVRTELNAAFRDAGVASLRRALQLVEKSPYRGAHQLLRLHQFCAGEITQGLRTLLTEMRPALAAEFIGVLGSHVPILCRVEPILLGHTVALLPLFPPLPAVAQRCGGVPGLIAGVAQAAALANCRNFSADFAASYRQLDRRLRAQTVQQAAAAKLPQALSLLGKLGR